MSKAKDNKAILNKYWLRGLTIKAWNNFIDGDAPVNKILFRVNSDLPKINKIGY